ncbi:MAG: hydroxymethylglutaryl-CoA reductase [Chloroflexota bacterium]|nr:hydroxymethylglutaryl-CoA reductase [Chloroflexota bacterium]
MRVPGFIVRQFYVKGSLRNADGGIQLQARNPLGDGRLVGIGRFTIDGEQIQPADVSAIRDGDAEWTRGEDVSPTTPVTFQKGDQVTFNVSGRTLRPGRHKLEVEIFERDAGRLSLTFEDDIKEG